MNNRTFLFTLLFLCSLAAVTAITFVDDTDAEFQTGTLSNINASANTLTLPWNGTGYNSSGTYSSRLLDMGQNPANSIEWGFTTPTGTTMLIQTRTGASTDQNDGTWTSYSSAYATSTGSVVTSSQQRYLQYRISLGTTDPLETPTVTSVQVNSTERSTNITRSTFTNATSNSTGAASYTVRVNDTYSISTVTATYAINSSGTWNASVLLSAVASPLFTFTIVPTNGWYQLRNSTLYVDFTVNVTNGTTNASTNMTFIDSIEFLSTAPVIDAIANQAVDQDEELTVSITATDYDNQTLTWYTSQNGSTITSTGNTSATFNWTPNATQLGLTTIIITANDGYVNSTRSFVVNVSDQNDAPTINAVTAITGYYGIRQLLVLSGFDLDFGQNLTFSLSPSLFSITSTNISPTGNSSSAVSGQWYGVANFTPLDDERGVHNLTFSVTDGELTANTSALMTISYCGDGVCQSTYETSLTCAVDCASQAEVPSIAIVAPDRNCANATGTFTFYDAKNRYACYNEGRVAGRQALCEGLEGVAVTIYVVDGSLITSVGTGTSGTNGTLSFQPGAAGEYRIIATKDDYINASSTVVVRSCTSDITVEETDVIINQPTTPLQNSGNKPPISEEEPGILVEEAGVLFLLFVYVITPVLLASLLYFGNIFYEVNKDTLPWLLEARIKAYELRQQAQPTVVKITQAVKPVTEPLGVFISAVWNPVKKALQPLVDKMNESLKKDSRPPSPK